MYHLTSDLEDNKKPRYFEENHKKRPRRKEKDRVPESSQKRPSTRNSTSIKVKKELPDPESHVRRLRRNAERESSPSVSRQNFEA